MSNNQFPIEVLDEEVRDYFLELSNHFGYNISALSTYYISLLSGMNGTRFKIKTIDTWVQYSTLWTVVVGSKGSNKSAPFDIIFDKPISQEVEQRLEISVRIKDLMSQLKEAKGESRKILLEEYHLLKGNRLFINDATKEAVVDVLSFNRYGLTLAKDELSGWFRSIERYKSNNVDFWLSSWDGKPFINDRKVEGETVVKNTAVTISGNIQPEVLTAISSEGTTTASGLIDRMLICNLENKAIKYSLKKLDVAIKQKYDDRVAIINHRIQDYYNISTEIVQLHEGLQQEFLDRINDLEDLKIKQDLPIMQGIFSKMQKYLARFMLLLIIQNDFEQYDDLVSDAYKIVEFYIKEAEEMYIGRSEIIEINELLKGVYGKKKKAEFLITHEDLGLNNTQVSFHSGFSRKSVIRLRRDLELKILDKQMSNPNIDKLQLMELLEKKELIMQAV